MVTESSSLRVQRVVSPVRTHDPDAVAKACLTTSSGAGQAGLDALPDD